MLAFLRFILIAFLVLTVIGYIFRFILKLYITRLAKKMTNQDQHKGQKVGDAYIKNTSAKEKVVNKDVGDYVDYEEIDPKDSN